MTGQSSGSNVPPDPSAGGQPPTPDTNLAVPQQGNQPESSSAAAQPSPAPQPGAPTSTLGGARAGQPAAPPGLLPPPSIFREVIRKVEKTRLDVEACAHVIVQAVAAKEEKVKDQRATQTVEPLKQIERYRKATPCDALWENMSGTDKFRLCSQCGLNVYDFKGMDQVEAEELVFKREAAKSTSFYRRRDGRFLISDCPVAIKRAQTIIVSVVGSVVVVGGLLFWLLTLPPPPKPAIIAAPPPVPVKAKPHRITRASDQPVATPGQAGFKLPDAAPVVQPFPQPENNPPTAESDSL